MPRQKLPDGWEYEQCGHGTLIASPKGKSAFGVYFAKERLNIETNNDHVRFEHPVALAVIRNAGQDPVFEAAMRFRDSRKETATDVNNAMFELFALLDSLEENG